MSKAGSEKSPARISGPKISGTAREARLKAALKANLGRRKAQARQRAGAVSDDSTPFDDATDTTPDGHSAQTPDPQQRT